MHGTQYAQYGKAIRERALNDQYMAVRVERLRERKKEARKGDILWWLVGEE